MHISALPRAETELPNSSLVPLKLRYLAPCLNHPLASKTLETAPKFLKKKVTHAF